MLFQIFLLINRQIVVFHLIKLIKEIHGNKLHSNYMHLYKDPLRFQYKLYQYLFSYPYEIKEKVNPNTLKLYPH